MRMSAKAKMMQGLRVLETNENTSRTSLDGMKESLHFSVPQAFYHRAWVLCAVDADVKKDAVLTTRLTRFGIWGRGGAMADTTLTLPRGERETGRWHRASGQRGIHRRRPEEDQGAALSRAGGFEDGRHRGSPRGTEGSVCGDEDRAVSRLRVSRKMGGLQVQQDRRRMPLATSTERRACLRSDLGKIARRAAAEAIATRQHLPQRRSARDDGQPSCGAADECELRWEISDVNGTSLATQEKTVTLDATGSESDITMPLTMPQLGWYGLHQRELTKAVTHAAEA